MDLLRIHRLQAGVRLVDMRRPEIHTVREVDFRKLHIRQQEFLILVHRILAGPAQNDLSFLLDAKRIRVAIIFLHYFGDFFGHDDDNFLVSPNFSQPADSLHQTILCDCG